MSQSGTPRSSAREYSNSSRRKGFTSVIDPVFASGIRIPSRAASKRRRYLASESFSASSERVRFLVLTAATVLRNTAAEDKGTSSTTLAARSGSSGCCGGCFDTLSRLIFGTAFLQRKVTHLFAPSLNRTRQDPGKASAISHPGLQTEMG